jgi:3-(3-hydroxy-phenyl)propionate hydroxylase
MTGHAVLIAAGGPTGLMLAGELALAGVDVAIADRFLAEGQRNSRLTAVGCCVMTPERVS